MKKLVFLIILLVFLVVPFALANTDLNLTLTSHTVSEGQPFDGNLNITFEGNMTASEMIYFYVNDILYHNNTLSEVYSKIAKAKIYPEAYIKKAQKADTVKYEFTGESTIIKAGLELDDAANKVKPTGNLSFKLTGAKYQGSLPDSITLDINNDGTSDYTFQGALINKYESLNKSYLFGKTTPDDWANIKGRSQIVYCQKTTALPSKNYNLSIYAKRNIGQAAEVIKGTIANEPVKALSCEGDNLCCSFPAAPEIGGEVSCSISKEIIKEKTIYLCIAIPGATADQMPYAVGYDNNQTINEGYVNGVKGTKDFFIYAKRQLFNTTLPTTPKEIKIDLTEVKSIFEKISSKEIPITIHSETAGIITLSDLKFDYDSNLIPLFMNKFIEYDYSPEIVYHNGSAIIALSAFPGLIAPVGESEDSTIYALFDNEMTDAEYFNVTAGAAIGIQRSTDTAYIGEVIDFRGVAPVVNNTTILSYSWDFGDNKLATGKEVSHVYITSGEFTVNLNITGLDVPTSTTTVIKVASVQDSLVFLVNDTKNQIETAQARVTAAPIDLQETLDYLGVSNTLLEASANNTLIENDMAQALSGTEINQTILEGLLNESLKLRSNIVVDFTMSKVIFDPKPIDTTYIPSALTLNQMQLDKFEERVVKAQETAAVSAEARTVTLEKIQSEETLILVKKTATGVGEYYEVLPTGVTPKKVISLGYQTLSGGLYKFTSSPFVYTLDATAYNSALSTLTLIVPSDLSSIEVEGGTQTQYTAYCGDGACESSESTDSCPQDCKPSKPYWIIIVVLVIIAIGAFIIWFYKDKLFKSRPKNTASKLFNSERDHQLIKTYVQSSITKGFTDMQMSLVLRKKGWRQDQVDYVINEVRNVKQQPQNHQPFLSKFIKVKK